MLVGCGALIVLLGLVSVVFVLKAKDLFGWAMTRFEVEIVAALPEDVTGEERQRLSQAFAAATEAVKSGRADSVALQRLQLLLAETARKREEGLSREDVLELIRSLEEVGGVDAGPNETLSEGGNRQVVRSRIGPRRQGRRLEWPRGPLSSRLALLASR